MSALFEQWDNVLDKCAYEPLENACLIEPESVYRAEGLFDDLLIHKRGRAPPEDRVVLDRSVSIVSPRDLLVNVVEEREVSVALRGVTLHHRVFLVRLHGVADAILGRLLEGDGDAGAIRKGGFRRVRSNLEQHIRHLIVRSRKANTDLRIGVGEDAARAEQYFHHIAERVVPAAALGLKLGSTARRADGALVMEPDHVE